MELIKTETMVHGCSEQAQQNAEALTPGSTLRFWGLVFNDDGTLRLDCTRLSEGAVFSSQSSASVHSGSAASQVVERGPGGMGQVITTGERTTID